MHYLCAMNSFEFDPKNVDDKGGTLLPEDWRELGEWRTIKLPQPKRQLPQHQAAKYRLAAVRRSGAEMVLFISLLVAALSFVLIVLSTF